MIGALRRRQVGTSRSAASRVMGSAGGQDVTDLRGSGHHAPGCDGRDVLSRIERNS